MHVIRAKNVNDALPIGLGLLQQYGVEAGSRNGVVTVLPDPVSTVYHYPEQCVLFDADRDANPFFHFFEALWILAGRDDVATLAEFLPRIKEFSDDGVVFSGAYGKRLRRIETEDDDGNDMVYDQLEAVVQRLREEPMTRRAVAAIYTYDDLWYDGKDTPCNDTVAFRADTGKLDITVFNRSNDMIWGAYGANAVQFAFIQMYVAARTGIPIGKYTQISNNMHAYEWNEYWQRAKLRYTEIPQTPYGAGVVRTTAMDFFDRPDHLDEDLKVFFATANIGGAGGPMPYYGDMTCHNGLIQQIARPMYIAWRLHKMGQTRAALEFASVIGADDWRIACSLWLTRRLARKEGH